MDKTSTAETVFTSSMMQTLRFKFGKNWRHFLENMDEAQLLEAVLSIQKMLGLDSLQGMSFLDAGCGSGLFSLAARKLGAKVRSFDYDQDSVACAKILKEKFFKQDPHWQIEEGDVLLPGYIEKLGKFDVVYSWGVLHHTGNMMQALNNISQTVKPNGKLFISIYNDQGRTSNHWKWIKKLYNCAPNFLKPLLIVYAFVRVGWLKNFLKNTVLYGDLLKTWNAYGENRGMSAWHDLIDWVGGYPFEVAKPEEIFEFYHLRGFELRHLKTCGGGSGCNEYVFEYIG